MTQPQVTDAIKLAAQLLKDWEVLERDTNRHEHEIDADALPDSLWHRKFAMQAQRNSVKAILQAALAHQDGEVVAWIYEQKQAGNVWVLTFALEHPADNPENAESPYMQQRNVRPLYAHPPAMEDAWRPIEEAPRDAYNRALSDAEDALADIGDGVESVGTYLDAIRKLHLPNPPKQKDAQNG